MVQESAMILGQTAPWDPGGAVPGLYIHQVQDQFRTMNLV